MNISSRKKSMGLSIKGKLLLFTLCVSLIPIATITSLYYFNVRNSIIQNKLNDLIAIAESKKSHVLYLLDTKKGRAMDFSTDGFIREELDTIIYGVKQNTIVNLNRHLSVNKKTIDPSILEIAVLDTDSKVVASTNEILIGKNIFSQEVFTQTIGKEYGEAFTSQPRYFPELDVNGIFVSAPLISKRRGEIIGVIINVYDSAILIDITNTMSREVRTIDFSTDGFIRDSLETINRGDFLIKSEAVITLNSHLLMNKKPLDSHITAIDVANQYGKVVASTNKKLIGRDIFDQGVFAKVMDKIYDEPCISSPHFNPHLKTMELDISAPITYKGQVMGIIVNHYDLSVLSEITTDRVGLGEVGEVYMVNRDGKILTESSYIEDAVLRQIVDTQPVRKILESGATMAGIYPNYRGISIVGASMYLPEYGWILLVEVDKEEVFAPLRILGIIALIVGFFSAAVVAGVSIVFAISMSRPIRKLTHATERLAGGNLEHEIKIPPPQ